MDGQEKRRVREAFLNRLAAVFTLGAKTEKQQRDFMNEVIRQVSEFSTPVLEKAADLLVRRSKTARWPAVGTCVDTCVEARNLIEPATEQPDKDKTADQPKDFARLPEPVAVEIALRADRLLVQTAIRDGWHVRLIDYVRDHRLLPGEQEQVQLYLASEDSRKRLETTPGADVSGSIAFLGLRGVVRRRELLAEVIQKIEFNLDNKGVFDGKSAPTEACGNR